MSDESLRSACIRLAHSKPKLRPHLLPLLKKEAAKDLKVSEKTRSAVNKALDAHFKDRDGRYLFRYSSLQDGIAEINLVLSKFDLQIDDKLTKDPKFKDDNLDAKGRPFIGYSAALTDMGGTPYPGSKFGISALKESDTPSAKFGFGAYIASNF